jgi:hypothetical protein
LQDAGEIGGFWETISALIGRAKGKAKKKKDATGSKFIPKGVAAWEGFPALGWSPILVGFYIAVWV